ncbi:MAG: HAMP domain-containing sensor histidine kinase [Thiohalobacterales bacterium]|nr:HAMP domain-containing sensor histidine kinase [Thiohalobacterales bacterium]
MRMSLYSKLALTLIVMLVLFGLNLLHNLRSSNEMYQQEIIQKLNHQLAAHIVAEEPLISDNAVNHAALENLFHTLMVINPSIEVYLLDPAGSIIAHAAPQDRVRRTTVDLQPVREFLSGTAVFPLTGDDPRGSGRSGVFSAARIPAAGPVQGYLYVILGGEQYAGVVESLRDSYIFRTNSQALLLALVIALLSGLVAFALLTRRLRGLTREIGDYYDDATSSTADETGGDEITQLDRAFRQMSGRIGRQMQELEKTDSLRRELVANISHDLRTPLTTLQGYLETLALKEATLDTADRKRYLRTAVAHCRRLTELVDELFELARLDSCEQISYSEPFSLSELAQDIVQKYQLKASEQHIELRADCHDSVPMVHGDIGMLARVLENLVDNALRHTSAGGHVSVDLNPRGDHVVVRVADTGCGIPADELDHVFDRFYHAGDDNNTGEQHAGLGLAIARRIIELHGSRIEVLSAEGKGTEFSFRMPVVAA